MKHRIGLCLLAGLLLLTSTAQAGSKDFGIGGLGYEHPGGVTLRALFGELGDEGGYFGLELQPWRLKWDGPLLGKNQQSRPLALRAGAFLLGNEQFSLGGGVIIEGLKTGLPASSGADPHGVWHGALGFELTAAIAPVRDGLLVMLFGGIEAAPDDQGRTFGEVQFIFPLSMGSWVLGVSGGVQVSSFVLHDVQLLTVTPVICVLPLPRR